MSLRILGAIWLLLLFGQAVAVRMSEENGVPAGTEGDYLASDLVLLAAEMEQALNRQLEKPWPDVSAAPASMLEREEQRLHLAEIENGFRKGGSRVTVAGDLEAWLDASVGEPRRGTEGFYLDGLTGWLELFHGSDRAPLLLHSTLLPEARSPWPSLSFETKGSVLELGTCFIRFLEGHPRWKLGELELVAESGGDGWWIRGSWIFEPPAS